jgi:hypothetical protein
VDPRQAAGEAEVYWLPSLDPRIVQLVGDTTGLALLTGSSLPARHVRRSDEGAYAKVGTSAGSSTAVSRDGFQPDVPLMALIPLDASAPTRLEALGHFWRILSGQPSSNPPGDISPARRARLALTLRAVDGRHARATRREIAEVLFGPEAVPDGVAFDDHHLRSRTARLIRDGLAMIAGGYRKLLKP